MCRGNARAHKNAWIGYCRLSRTMITGYRRKKLGQPSDKQTGGDSPRAPWRAVLFSEIVFPICLAILFVIAYLFVKSFPDVSGKENAPPLIRLAVVALGPIVWNAAVLLVLFLISLVVGPMLDTVAPKFGSVMAFIAHALALIGIIAFFEFLVSIFNNIFYESSVLTQSFAVVLGALGCFTCGTWFDCCHSHSARHLQTLHLRIPVS